MSSFDTQTNNRVSERAQKRVMKEIRDMMDSKVVLAEGGIYFIPDEDDIYKCYVMLVGGDDTPYAHGFYFFTFNFPENYPMVPPKGASMTQGRLETKTGESVAMRFNPNLYTCGKLCLSILGTWQGPGWVPTMTISIVCNTIQALVLHEAPLKNEPAYYDSAPTDPQVVNYSKIVSYANYKVAILDMLEKRPAPAFDEFYPTMREVFLARFDKIMAGLEKERSTSTPTLRDDAYGMGEIVCNYDEIGHRMLAMRDRIMAEASAPAPAPAPVPVSTQEEGEEKKEE